MRLSRLSLIHLRVFPLAQKSSPATAPPAVGRDRVSGFELRKRNSIGMMEALSCYHIAAREKSRPSLGVRVRVEKKRVRAEEPGSEDKQRR